MVISAHRPWEEPSPEPDLSDYTSNVIRLFVEGLEQRKAGQVLDVGPVCSDNISFFARRVKKIYVCDMFLRLDRDRRKGLPPSRTWQHLDYPPRSFDGILLWDLTDRLKAHEVRDLVKRCHTMSRPGGMVMAFVLGQKAIPPVVNAFAMHAFKTGRLDVWFGGEAWRPLVHVRDTAAAHICCLEADPDKVRGEIFNLVYKNYRILELAHRVRKALAEMAINVDVDVNYDQADNRSYRSDGRKITKVLGFTPSVSVEEGVKEIVEVLRTGQNRDFDHPIYYNMRWMKLLVEVEERLKKTGKVL